MGFLEFLFGKPRTEQRRDLPAVAGGSRALTPQASILDVRVGDVIGYEGTDYVVRNRHVFSSHGFDWFSFQLVDTISGQKLWIDAEDDDELEVAVSRPLDLPLTLPLPERLVHQGRSYALEEHGVARVLIESEDSTPHKTQVEFWDYCDDSEEHFLGIERWGDELEVSSGHAIEPFELTILAAGSDA
ncbi:MAG: DUF4178 domain-containing protein [Candidatus Sericytochromatia bacterium]